MTSRFASGGSVGCEPIGSWSKANHSGYEDEEVLGEKNLRVDGNGQKDAKTCQTNANKPCRSPGWPSAGVVFISCSLRTKTRFCGMETTAMGGEIFKELTNAVCSTRAESYVANGRGIPRGALASTHRNHETRFRAGGMRRAPADVKTKPIWLLYGKSRCLRAFL